MKNNKALSILILISIYSCNGNFHDKIIGEWTIVPQNRPEKILEQFTFKETNEVEVVTDDLFKSSLTYSILANKLTIKSLDTVISSKLNFINKDSLILFDSLLYVKNFPIRYSDHPIIHKYDLLNYETSKIIELNNELNRILHYYKVGSDVVLRGGLNKLEFTQLNLFLENNSNPEIAIYIGQNITLTDLNKLYFYIGHAGHRNVKLVTNKSKLFEVQYVRDKIEIWWDELQIFSNTSKLLPPIFPPPEEHLRSKSQYLKDGGNEIAITNSKEIDKLEAINKTEKYVVTIDVNLNLKDYFKVKKTIRELRRLNKLVKTEIK